MTVVQPNSISGINSITVAANDSLSIHKSDGSLLREIVSSTGVSTFHAVEVSKGGADLVVGVSTFFVDNSAGKVGVGTDTPGFTIEALAASNATIRVEEVTNAVFTDLRSNSTGGLVRTASDHPLVLGTNQTERMRIEKAGRVNIVGVCSAAGGFVGDGSALTGIAGTEITNSDFQVGVSTFFVDYSTGIIGIGTGAPYANGLLHCDGNLVLTSSSNAPKIIFDEFGTGTDPKAQIEMDQSSSTEASLIFHTEGGGTLLERFRIKPTNDVAVFTGSNSATLTLRNDTSNEMQLHTGGSDALILGTGGENERLRIRADGRISIASSLAVTGVCTAAAFVPQQGQLGNRNLIINGDMNIAQRGSGTVTSAGQFCADRWKFYASGGSFSLGRGTITTGTPFDLGFRQYSTLTNTSGASGVTDYRLIRYIVEAQDLATCGWDYTDANSYITLSFWVRSSVAFTPYAYMHTQDGTEKAYIFSLGALSADTWTKIEKTIPGGTGVEFTRNSGSGALLDFVTFWGTDYTGTVSTDAWVTYSGSTRTPDMSNSWAVASGATFDITGVQLEVGPYATPFEHRTFADELRRCQRYYQFTQSNNQSYVNGNQHVGGQGSFMTQMRSNSYTVAQDAAQGGNITDLGNLPSIHVKREYGLGFYQYATAAGNWYFYRNLTMDAEL